MKVALTLFLIFAVIFRLGIANGDVNEFISPENNNHTESKFDVTTRGLGTQQHRIIRSITFTSVFKLAVVNQPLYHTALELFYCAQCFLASGRRPDTTCQSTCRRTVQTHVDPPSHSVISQYRGCQSCLETSVRPNVRCHDACTVSDLARILSATIQYIYS